MIKEFKYFAPKTVRQTLSLLSRHKDEARVIAGGQSLLILMKDRLISPAYLIDIKAIPALNYIKYDKSEGLRIGALTSHRSIEFSPLVQQRFAVLSEMERSLASIQTRNWGTIGGNLCQADPAGDPAPVLIALDSVLALRSLKRVRTVAVEDFFTGYLETVLEPDEMVTEIQVPNPLPRTGTAYSKISLQDGDFALVSAAVSITLGARNNTCQNARIALGAAGPVPIRAVKAERVLVGKEITDSLLEKAGQVASEEIEPRADVHATEEYRKDVAKVLVKRVGLEALNRARKA